MSIINVLIFILFLLLILLMCKNRVKGGMAFCNTYSLNEEHSLPFSSIACSAGIFAFCATHNKLIINILDTVIPSYEAMGDNLQEPDKSKLTLYRENKAAYSNKEVIRMLTDTGHGFTFNHIYEYFKNTLRAPEVKNKFAVDTLSYLTLILDIKTGTRDPHNSNKVYWDVYDPHTEQDFQLVEYEFDNNEENDSNYIDIQNYCTKVNDDNEHKPRVTSLYIITKGHTSYMLYENIWYHMNMYTYTQNSPNMKAIALMNSASMYTYLKKLNERTSILSIGYIIPKKYIKPCLCTEPENPHSHIYDLIISDSSEMYNQRLIDEISRLSGSKSCSFKILIIEVDGNEYPHVPIDVEVNDYKELVNEVNNKIKDITGETISIVDHNYTFKHKGRDFLSYKPHNWPDLVETLKKISEEPIQITVNVDTVKMLETPETINVMVDEEDGRTMLYPEIKSYDDLYNRIISNYKGYKVTLYTKKFLLTAENWDSIIRDNYLEDLNKGKIKQIPVEARFEKLPQPLPSMPPVPPPPLPSMPPPPD